MKIVLLGPPGVGKGTQGSVIAAKFQIPHLSTGDILRGEMAAQTPLGIRITDIMTAGQYVDDNLMNQIVQSRIAKPDCAGGYVLDGYPRTLEQAKYLDRLDTISVVLLFHAPDEILIQRLLDRKRPGETREIIRTRMDVYSENTDNLIDYYVHNDLLVCLDATEPVTSVSNSVFQAIAITA